MTAVVADQAAVDMPELDNLPEHLRAIAAGHVPEHIAAVVTSAPPLTSEQIERVRALLRSSLAEARS